MGFVGKGICFFKALPGPQTDPLVNILVIPFPSSGPDILPGK